MHVQLLSRCLRIPAIAVVLILVTGVVGQAQEVDTRPGLAVFPFTNGGSFGPESEDLAPLEVGIQQMVLTELAQNHNLRVVERSQLRGILDEQEMVRSGQVDPSTAARLGRLVGARYAVTGSFIDLFGNFRLDGRVIDVETGEVMHPVELRGRKQDLYQMLVDFAGDIVEGVALPPLELALVQERRARVIPPEAVTLFSRAQVLEDGGRRDQAIELYRQIEARFPDMIEAQEALRQLAGE